MLDKNVKVINEKTPVTLSILGIIISALVLGVIHVQSINSTANAASNAAAANKVEITNLKTSDEKIREEYNKTLIDLNSRLGRIEGALELKVITQ